MLETVEETTEETLLLENLDVRLVVVEALAESVPEAELRPSEELDIVDENVGSDIGDERVAETEILGSESVADVVPED